MNPDVVLRLVLAKLKEAKRTRSTATAADAVQHLRDLADWIECGGFLPTVVNLDVRGER